MPTSEAKKEYFSNPSIVFFDAVTGEIINPFDLDEKVSYSHAAINERLAATIRHGCLSEFIWINPITVLETANENVRLLSFDEIMSIFGK